MRIAKTVKKLAAVCAAAVLCAGAAGMSSLAAPSVQDGIEVTVTPEKEVYSQGDAVTAVVSVTNTNAFAVEDVLIKGVIPDGYELSEDAAQTKELKVMEAGETAEMTLTYVPKSTASGGVGGQDPAEGTGDAEDKASKKDAAGARTGDENGLALWVGLMAAGAAGIITVVVIRKKGKRFGKRFFALFLCFAVSAPIVFGHPVQAEDTDNSGTITAAGSARVGDKDVELAVVVEYVLPEKADPGQEVEDQDSDGAPDAIEEAFGTDNSKDDTDGDGLTDYEEIYMTGTDPLLEDSDENGILDVQEDVDADGLTNGDEVRLGTNPLRADSDGDGLTDGEENNQYRTDPLVYDTDGDGVSDGDEVHRYGTDPLTAQSAFQVSESCQAEGDTVEAKVEVSLPGPQADTLSVEPVEDTNFFPEDMPGYMGKAYDFTVDGSFDQATISFDFDAASLPQGTEPAIFYFNEEEQTLEELETTVSGNTASAVTNHFSTYILLNRTLYYDSFAWEDVWEDTENYDEVETALVIDDSGSMDWNDGENQRLTVAGELIDRLPDGSRIGVVKFESSTTLLTEEFTTDKAQAKSYLTTDYFRSNGGTRMYDAISDACSLYPDASGNVLRTMVVLSDGDSSDTSRHSEVVAEAQEKGIRIYTVGLGSSTTYFNSYLEPLAQGTGGTFYLAADAGQLADIYADINKRIDLETDTDGDTIPDYYEDHMVSFNGVKVQLDKTKADTDGDGLPDNEEVEVQLVYNEDKTKVYVKGKILSMPILEDTDFDGIPDSQDPNRQNGTFRGDLLGYYDVSGAAYTMDYRDFFEPADRYSNNLASASLMFANTIYSDSGFRYEYNGKETEDIVEMMQLHGFTDVVDYKLAEGYTEPGLETAGYTDDDISEVAVGSHQVTYQGTTKTVLGVVIRGTNGTIEEWSSNFDMGDPDTWASQYHKGFYVTEERIKSFVDRYVTARLGAAQDLVYWITGHSRGAALANILSARLIDEGKSVFAYTFATPSTTVNGSRSDAKYNSIFNFANTSDFVTYVPLEQWDFGRFGNTKELTLEDTPLESEWCDRTGIDKYNAMNESVITLATNRIVKSCSGTWAEVFDRAGSQDIDDDQYACISERAKRYCDLTERTSIFGNHKGYKLYPSTAFIFQLGAEMLAGSDQEKDNVGVIVKELWNSKYAVVIVLFLGDAVWNMGSFEDLSLGESLIGDGHAPATYYILTQGD